MKEVKSKPFTCKEEGNVSDENHLTKWTTLIPEVYYNIIAWVAPGTLLIGATILTFYPDKAFEILNTPDISWATITALLISI